MVGSNNKEGKMPSWICEGCTTPCVVSNDNEQACPDEGVCIFTPPYNGDAKWHKAEDSAICEDGVLTVKVILSNESWERWNAESKRLTKLIDNAR